MKKVSTIVCIALVVYCLVLIRSCHDNNKESTPAVAGATPPATPAQPTPSTPAEKTPTAETAEKTSSTTPTRKSGYKVIKEEVKKMEEKAAAEAPPPVYKGWTATKGTDASSGKKYVRYIYKGGDDVERIPCIGPIESSASEGVIYDVIDKKGDNLQFRFDGEKINKKTTNTDGKEEWIIIDNDEFNTKICITFRSVKFVPDDPDHFKGWLDVPVDTFVPDP